jgi:dynein heavy chain
MFSEYLENSLEFMRKNIKEVSPTVNNNLVSSLMKIMDCFFIPYTETEIKKVSQEDIEILESMIENLFIFALIWSVGSTTDYDGRLMFNQWLRDQIKSNPKVKMPETGSIYDYQFDDKGAVKEFVSWSKQYANFSID